MLISKRSGLVLIVTWWFDEPSITRNGQSRPCGRHTLIEIDLIRLEAVFAIFVRDECVVRDEKVWRISLKMLLKLASRCWFFFFWCERNMLVCFFRLLTEIVSGFAFITKFTKIFCEHPRVRLTFWKLMCWICWHPRVHLKFHVRFFLSSWLTPLKLTLKMDCAGSSYCQIIGWSLTMKRKFFLKIFKFLGMIEALFTDLWNCGCCLCQRWCKRSPNRSSYLLKFPSEWQKKFGKDLFAFWIGKHVLDTDFWSHSDATMKDLWQRFFWSLNGWSRSWFKIMLWSWGPFIHFVKRSSLFFCVMKLIASAGSACEEIVKFLVQKLV